MSIDKRINFQGGGMSMGNASNQKQSASKASTTSKSTSPGTGGSTGNLGGGGGGQESEYRKYKAPTKATYTAETIDQKPITGADYQNSKNEFINNLNANNLFQSQITNTPFVPYQGGARTTDYYNPNPLKNLFKMAAGIAIPGAGFLMNYGGKFKDGIMSLNNRIQNSDFGRSKNLMDYLDMKKYGGFDEREMTRRINMDEAKLIQADIDSGMYDGFERPTQTFSFDNSGMTKGDLNNLESLIEASQAPQNSNTDFMYASPQFQEGIDNSMYGADRMLFGSNSPNELYYDGDVLPDGEVYESEADGITNYDFAKGGIASL